MKRIAMLMGLLCLAGVLSAEENTLPKVVRVVGTSEVKVVPDRAVIDIGVEKQDSRATTAKHAEDTAIRKILASLRANAIDEKDMQTTYLSLQPRTIYVKKVRTSYFVAEQTLTVTVRDLSKLDGILESLVQAGGNRIDQISYEVSDLRKYRDQARDLAVKAAQEKAEALARAVGQNIGKAQTIEEVNDTAYGYYANSTLGMVKKTRSPAPSIALGQKTITASVSVAFDLN
ncbi:MAG TPA: SIMPL domain-containing protein [Candidatus Angelobacter sp.]|nr:SIMPL domain-containing protein [Candidatus Angelobacter sp.]